MRSLLILLALTTPAHAWQATIGATCTLQHSTAQAEVKLLYDPSLPRYTITITRSGTAWQPAAVFGLTFEGAASNTISTSRHMLQDGGASVTVEDRGFGNVLDGLQFNRSVTAFLGDQTLQFDLTGAAPAVQAFRDCRPAPSV